MADNFVVNIPTTTGAKFAADEYVDESGESVQHQRVKLQHGANNTGIDTSTANPLPVTGPVTDAQLRAAAVPVSAASLPLPAGAATETTLSAVNTKTPALGQAAMAASSPVVIASDQSAIPVSGPLTDTQLRASAVPVSLASVPSHAVTNAGTFPVQDSEKVADNAGFTDGTTKVQPAGFVFDEVAGTALTENDAAVARIDSKRAQVLVIEDATTRGQRATVSAAGAIKVDASSVAVPITDNAGSLTVDGTVAVSSVGGTVTISGAVTNTVLSVVGTGTEATAQRVTIATDSTGVLSVDDNGGSLTVDAASLPLPTGAATETTLAALNTKVTTCNTGAVVVASGAITADTELTTADLDTGAGTDTRAVVGIVGAKSGGAQLIPGDATAGLKVDLGADNDVTVTSGTITAVTTITNVVHVDDNAGSLTVDGAVTVSGTATVSQSTATNLKAEVVGPTADNAANPTAKLAVLSGVANAAAPTRIEGNVVPLRTNIAGDVAVTLDGETQVGQIVDGVTPTIKATVLDLANGNPISVVIAHPSTGGAFGAVIQMGADATTMASIIDGGSGGQALVVASGSVGHGIPDSSLSPAHDAPIKIGGKAASSAPAAVTAGQRVNGYFDLNGRLIVHDDQAIPAGTNAIGKLAANSGVDIGDVDVLSLPTIPAGTNTIGNVVIVSGATGGATPYKLISAATTNATSVKASAGKLIGYYLSNVNAAARYVKFYNKATAPTVGTDTPVLTLMIPATGAANLDSACGIDFGTGIAFATTTGAADSDTGAVAADEIIVNLWYK